MSDRDQEIFDTKMVVFLWFKEGVTPMVRGKVLNDIQQCLIIQPLEFKGAFVRATLELDPVKRPWNKAQAVFLGVMRNYAKLSSETFDIRWVDSGLGTDWKKCGRDPTCVFHNRHNLGTKS